MPLFTTLNKFKRYPIILYSLFLYLLISIYFMFSGYWEVSIVYILLFLSLLILYPKVKPVISILIVSYSIPIAIIISVSSTITNGTFFYLISGILVGVLSGSFIISNDDNLKTFGYVLISIGIVWNFVKLFESLTFPIGNPRWVTDVLVLDPFFLVFILVHYNSYAGFLPTIKVKARRKVSTRSSAKFVISNLPNNLKAGIEINNKYYYGNPEIIVNASGNWRACYIDNGNSMYEPNPDSGVVTPGKIISITYRYVPKNSSPNSVKFIIRGLPSKCPPIIELDGKIWTTAVKRNTDYIIEIPNPVSWKVTKISCSTGNFEPNKTSDRAKPGETVIIEYIQNKPVQSRPIYGSIQIQWDPNTWVGKKLSVYTIKKYVGEGGNGYVLEGEYDNKKVAIKVFKIFSGNAKEYFKELSTEASNLINLSSHDNIMKIYAINVDSFVISDILKGKTELYEKDPPMIVMEFMKGGTLKDLIDNDLYYYSVKWKRVVWKALCQIGSALSYIHSNGYVHMDVKPQNIFLVKKSKDPSELDLVNFKLGDLGSAVGINRKIRQLTVEYAPPEVFIESAKPYFDIFALGMTAYVAITRKINRPDLQGMEDAFNCYTKGDMNCVSLKVAEARKKLYNWDPPVDDIIKRMLSAEPQKRPTAKEIVEYIKRVEPSLCK